MQREREREGESGDFQPKRFQRTNRYWTKTKCSKLCCEEKRWPPTKYVVRKFDVGNDGVSRRRPHAHAIRRRKLSMWQQVQARIWGFGTFAQDRARGKKKKKKISSSLPVPLSSFRVILVGLCSIFFFFHSGCALLNDYVNVHEKVLVTHTKKYQMNLHRPQRLQSLSQHHKDYVARTRERGEKGRGLERSLCSIPFRSIRPVKLVRLH